MNIASTTLSRRAARSLKEAGIDNVTLIVGDGTRGLPEEAPFDAINLLTRLGGAHIT